VEWVSVISNGKIENELRGVVESEMVCYGKERRVQCKYILISQKHRDGEKVDGIEVVNDDRRNVF
jgi:hypothetical protein